MDADRLYELLERLGNLLRADERRLGEREALQPVQVRALAYLSRANRYSDNPAAVTDYLRVTKGTASQTLQRLQERGLISARPDPQDRRRHHLSLTARGRRALDQAIPHDSLAAALGEVDDPAALDRGLTALLRGLQRAHGGRAFGICNSCRHFRDLDGRYQCGLTEEPLSVDDSARLCREHEPARSAG